MEIQTYLAMTQEEFHSVLPRRPAWMACHFSPGGTLQNLPEALPEPSLLILDDRLPFDGQMPERILAQLTRAVSSLPCDGLLLDFQREPTPVALALASALTQGLPCPVAVPEAYAGGLSRPVFISLIPPHESISRALSPWQGRELWLELSPGFERITVTEDGVSIESSTPEPALPHPLPALHCHFRQEIAEAQVQFTLGRTGADLEALLEEAAGYGVARGIGLWQEFQI